MKFKLISIIGIILFLFAGNAFATATYDAVNDNIELTGSNTLSSISSDLSNTSLAEWYAANDTLLLKKPIDHDNGFTENSLTITDGETLKMLNGGGDGDVYIYMRRNFHISIEGGATITSSGNQGYINIRDNGGPGIVVTSASWANPVTFENLGYSGQDALHLQVSSPTIEYCIFNNCEQAIYFEATTGAPIVRHNRFNDGIDYQIYTYGTDNSVIFNNTILNTTGLISSEIVRCGDYANVSYNIFDGFDSGTAIKAKEAHSAVYHDNVINGSGQGISVYVNQVDWEWDKRIISYNNIMSNCSNGVSWTRGPLESYNNTYTDTTADVYDNPHIGYIYNETCTNGNNQNLINKLTSLTQENITFENITVDDSYVRFLSLRNDQENFTFKDISTEDDIFLDDFGWNDNKFININASSWTYGGDAVSRTYYYPNIVVKDSEGNPLQGVNITINNTINSTQNGLNLNNTELSYWVTNSNGGLPVPTLTNKDSALILLDKFENNSGVIEDMEYDITFSLENYTNYTLTGINPNTTWYSSDIYDLNNTISITLNEPPSPITPSDWSDDTQAIDLWIAVGGLLILVLIILIIGILLSAIYFQSKAGFKLLIVGTYAALVLVVLFEVIILIGSKFTEMLP